MEEHNSTHIGYEIVMCPHCKKEVTHIDGTLYVCPYCDGKLNDNIKQIEETKTIPNSNKIKSFLVNSKTTVSLAFIIIILLVFGFSVQNSNQKLIGNLNTRLNDITSENDTLQEAYDDLCDKNASWKEDYKELYSDYIIIENEVKNYKDQQATINDQNAKLVELQNQYSQLESERNSLQIQVDAKKAEQQRIAQEQESQRIAQEQANAVTGTVYWVSEGKAYHSTPECATLKRSSNIHSGTVAQSGRRACKVCN